MDWSAVQRYGQESLLILGLGLFALTAALCTLGSGLLVQRSANREVSVAIATSVAPPIDIAPTRPPQGASSPVPTSGALLPTLVPTTTPPVLGPGGPVAPTPGLPQPTTSPFEATPPPLPTSPPPTMGGVMTPPPLPGGQLPPTIPPPATQIPSATAAGSQGVGSATATATPTPTTTATQQSGATPTRTATPEGSYPNPQPTTTPEGYP